MDLQLIRACLDRKTYENIRAKVPYEVVGKTTSTMLQWIGAYFTSNPDIPMVTPEHLKAYVSVRMQDSLEDPGVQVLLKLCDELKTVPDPDVPTVLNMLMEQDFAGRLGALYVRFEQGHEIDFFTEVEELTREYSVLRKIKDVPSFDIETALAELRDGRGVTFGGMQFFKEYISPVRGGASIAFAARPGQGKSSWLCYTLTRSAGSIREFFGEDRPVMFCVNEGEPGRVPPRLYQAAMGATLSELYDKLDAGTLIKDYEEAIQAPGDFIQTVPIAGWSFSDLERKIEETRPSVVVVDMLEHVGLHGNLSKAERTTEQWVKIRELALVYDFIAISTVQIGYEGANTLFPTYDHINYSKTGVQSATDIIIMMGSLGNPQMQHVRGFHVAKNKFTVQGKPEQVELEAVFDKDRSTFNDGAVTMDQVPGTKQVKHGLE